MLATILALSLASPFQDRPVSAAKSEDPTAGMSDKERAAYARWQGWLASEPGATPPAFEPGVLEPEPAYEPEYRLNVLAGLRVLEDDWNPVERQLSYALELEVHRPDMPVSLEFGLARSEDSEDGIGPSGVDVSVESWELYAGGRWWWFETYEDVRMYTSAGVSVTRFEGDSSFPALTGDETAPGLYIRLGGIWPVSRKATFGLDLRYTAVDDFDRGGVEIGSDSAVISAVLGFGL